MVDVLPGYKHKYIKNNETFSAGYMSAIPPWQPNRPGIAYYLIFPLNEVYV